MNNTTKLKEALRLLGCKDAIVRDVYCSGTAFSSNEHECWLIAVNVKKGAEF